VTTVETQNDSISTDEKRSRADIGANIRMTRPQSFLVRMVLFVLVVIVVATLLAEQLQRTFMANPGLNGLILGVLLFGIGYVFRQVQILGPEVEWAERFRHREEGMAVHRPPTLLTPMATILSEQPSHRWLSTLSMRSLLDGIASRLDESREMARYLIGLLIFLGLLGTFWGLLQTVTAVGQTIGNLTIEVDDPAGLFGSLKSGLEAPLAGMGTAFSSSLFGLAGSLILGFLELQAGQAQNRFYNELEEWLSSITRLSSGLGTGDGEQSVPAYVSALLEQTAESLDNLQHTIALGAESNAAANKALLSLSDKLGTLTDQMKSEQDLMIKLAESQMEIKPVLERLAEATSAESSVSLDEASRMHLRNLDVYVKRFLEESGPAREHLIQEFRSEIKLLARTMAALGRASN
jgi:hypothetical protein